MTQSDRIEQKLDTLLKMLSANKEPEYPVGSLAARINQAKADLAMKCQRRSV